MSHMPMSTVGLGEIGPGYVSGLLSFFISKKTNSYYVVGLRKAREKDRHKVYLTLNPTASKHLIVSKESDPKLWFYDDQSREWKIDTGILLSAIRDQLSIWGFNQLLGGTSSSMTTNRLSTLEVIKMLVEAGIIPPDLDEYRKEAEQEEKDFQETQKALEEEEKRMDEQRRNTLKEKIKQQKEWDSRRGALMGAGSWSGTDTTVTGVDRAVSVADRVVSAVRDARVSISPEIPKPMKKPSLKSKFFKAIKNVD